MCSFKIPHKLYGIHMDTTLTDSRKYFIEYLEILPHIKKYSKDNRGVWYIFELSDFIINIFHKFSEKGIGTKVRHYPWKTCLVSTYYMGSIRRIEYEKSKYGEYKYTSCNPEYDKVTLMTGELFYLVDQEITMSDTPIHTHAFRDLGGTILAIHYDYKFLVEFFKPYIMSDLILYKKRYIGVLNPYLMTTFVYKLLRDIRSKIDLQYSRTSKFNVYRVDHNFSHKYYPFKS